MQDLWSAKSSSNTLGLEEARASGKGVLFAYPFSLQLSKGIDWRKIGCGFWIGSLCRTMKTLTFLTFGSDNLTPKFDRGETYLKCRNDQACHPLLIWPLGKGWNRILKNTSQWAMYVILEGKRKHITTTTHMTHIYGPYIYIYIIYIMYIYISSYIHNISSWRKHRHVLHSLVGLFFLDHIPTEVVRHIPTPKDSGGRFCVVFVENLGKLESENKSWVNVNM